MRLSTAVDRDDERSISVLHAALASGVNLLDTAPSYGTGEQDQHHNERLVARALATAPGGAPDVVVVTKCGLVREGTAWVPDGRARTLRASCEASLEALGGRPIDLLLLHAPDPRTPIATSARALASLVEEGLVRAAGLSNVSLRELEEASNEMDVRALELAMCPLDEAVYRSGVVAKAIARGLPLLAHSPIGGPKKKRRLERDPEIATIARAHATTPGTIALAWLYASSSLVVPLPGATRIETARLAGLASTIALRDEDRATLDRRFEPAARALGRGASPSTARTGAEVVIVMGIQAAGKTTHVRSLVDAGAARLNRDERGGTLRGLARELDERLRAGPGRFVLDNTYGTRASRSEIVDVARKHGAGVRCVWIDTPLEIAQVHAVNRLLDTHGRLPDPTELRRLSQKDPTTFAPGVQLRFRRSFEPPGEDEGFDAIEVVAYEPRAASGHRTGVAFAAELARSPTRAGELRALLREHTGSEVIAFAFCEPSERASTDERVRELGAELGVAVRVEACVHGGGPPICWCRPPLAGLVVPWMRDREVSAARMLVVGAAPAHAAMARALGAAYREISPDLRAADR